MRSSSKVRYTYQDYLSIPEHAPGRHEIVDGELFVTPAPRFRHQQVVVNVTRLLANLAIEHELGEVATGPVAVRLHEEGVVEPDVVFVRSERLEMVDPDGAINGPPDLVVEVLSPSNEDYDRTLKRKEYMAYGVEELWLVDADQETVEVWRSEREEPDVVQGGLTWSLGRESFEISLEDIFRG